MASKSRSAKHSVREQLKSQPYRFSFVQACRLIELISRRQGQNLHPIGEDSLPSEECVRIAAQPSRSFPSAEVAAISNLDRDVSEDSGEPPKITVTFMGLFGPSGVLPQHDTQRIIDAGNKKNPERDFLDVFNHRIVSHFYRASIKYSIPFAFEATYCKPGTPENTVTSSLYAIAGMGTPGLRQRLEIVDELAIEFAGLLGHTPKNAISLQRMLGSYFDLTVEVQQFVGQWMYLSAENKSEMPTRGMMLGQNCELGLTFILGERVWDIAGRFRIKLGPLTRVQFESFLPGSQNLIKVAQLVQLYVGQQFDFDVQLELLADEVPATSLGEDSRLGYNSWLFAVQPIENKCDAVLSQSGQPLNSYHNSTI
jgi:type VI secretion system protein ImpH